MAVLPLQPNQANSRTFLRRYARDGIVDFAGQHMDGAAGPTPFQPYTAWIPIDFAPGYNQAFTSWDQNQSPSGTTIGGRGLAFGFLPNEQTHSAHVYQGLNRLPWRNHTVISLVRPTLGVSTTINELRNSVLSGNAPGIFYTDNSIQQMGVGMTATRRLAGGINYGEGQQSIGVVAPVQLAIGPEIVYERVSPWMYEVGTYRNGRLISAHREDNRPGNDANYFSIGSPFGGLPKIANYRGVLDSIVHDGSALSDAAIMSFAQWMLDDIGYVEPTAALTFIGDSETVGWYTAGGASYAGVAESRLRGRGVQVNAFGYYGARADEWCRSFPQIVDPEAIGAGRSFSRHVYVLMIGYNNIAAGHSATQIASYIETLAKVCRSQGNATAVLSYVPHTNGLIGSSYEQVRRELRKELLSSTTLDGVFDVDTELPELVAESVKAQAVAHCTAGLSFQLPNQTGRPLDGKYPFVWASTPHDIGVDGVHLGPIGYMSMGTALAKHPAILSKLGLLR